MPKCLLTVQFLASNSLHNHGLRTPREEITFTARPKIHSHSQVYRYGQSIFCLPQRPKFSDIFDLCLHWLSVVRDLDLTFSTLLFINKIGQESFFVKNIYFSQFVTKKSYNHQETDFTRGTPPLHTQRIKNRAKE